MATFNLVEFQAFIEAKGALRSRWRLFSLLRAAAEAKKPSAAQEVPTETISRWQGSDARLLGAIWCRLFDRCGSAELAKDSAGTKHYFVPAPAYAEDSYERASWFSPLTPLPGEVRLLREEALFAHHFVIRPCAA